MISSFLTQTSGHQIAS